MEKDNEQLQKAIRQAAASIWMDKLPLNKEYVAKYYTKRIRERRQINSPKLSLKRGETHVK